ncbi:Cytochrome P450, partial [Fusarium albosuccineum]
QVTSPLRNIPGPFLARFSRLWYLYQSYAGNFHLKNIELHRKHGRIVRLAPNTYSISEPDKTVYGAGSRFEKNAWYEAWKHPDPKSFTLFADRNIKRHNDSRRRVQNLYSMSTLVSYEAPVNDCNALLHDKLQDFAATGETIDLGHWLQCYAFDVIGCITFSKRFGFLDKGEDIHGMIEALANSLVMQIWTMALAPLPVYAGLHPYLHPILERFPGSGAAGLTTFMNVVHGMIAERKIARKAGNLDKPRPEPSEIQDAPQDFLEKIMNAQDDDPSKVTDAHIFVAGWANINAGSDTTAVSLSAILYHLIRNPDKLQTLVDEIAAARTKGKCTKLAVPFAEAQNMAYLQACIKEGVRLHSATGLPLWRVVPEGGATVCGQFFPGGSTVGVNTWVAHYSEGVYGIDAGDFRPERWLEASVDELRRMNSYFMPFGVGSRTCIGRHISMLEMSKVLPVLVQNFDFELVGNEDGWKTRNYWFVKPLDFKVNVRMKN